MESLHESGHVAGNNKLTPVNKKRTNAHARTGQMQKVQEVIRLQFLYILSRSVH